MKTDRRRNMPPEPEPRQPQVLDQGSPAPACWPRSPDVMERARLASVAGPSLIQGHWLTGVVSPTYDFLPQGPSLSTCPGGKLP